MKWSDLLECAAITLGGTLGGVQLTGRLTSMEHLQVVGPTFYVLAILLYFVLGAWAGGYLGLKLYQEIVGAADRNTKRKRAVRAPLPPARTIQGRR